MTFGSLDFIEDALEILDKSEFPYLLIVARGEDHLLISSSLGEDNTNARILKDSVEDGEVSRLILEHLEEFYDV